MTQIHTHIDTLISNSGLCASGDGAEATHRRFSSGAQVRAIDLCASCVRAEIRDWNAAVESGEVTKAGGIYEEASPFHTDDPVRVEFRTLKSLRAAEIAASGRFTDAEKNWRWYEIAIEGTAAQCARAADRYYRAEEAWRIASNRAAAISY